MADDIIRIGFVGAGGNTELRHIPGLQAIEGVELVSVANRSRASGQRIADKYGLSEVYDDWVELIEADDTDAICIGTWPYMHRDMVLAALESGKHVQTEARMAMDAAQAREMLDASRLAPHLVAQIVPSPMTLRVDKTVKRLIAEGYLGDVLSVNLVVNDRTMHPAGFIEPSAPFHWRHNRDFSGYNIMQMGIWYEAMMRWVGPAQTVQSLTRAHVKSRRDANGDAQVITIPDHIEVLCEMYSGPLLHIRMSAITGHSPQNGAWLFGTDGTLFIESPGMALYGGRRDDGEMSEIDIPADEQGAWRVEEEFINAIRGKEEITHTNFADGVRYMEFTEAVTISAQSGEKVHLPL